MNTTLLLGFGNPDRQDDGLAWHILTRLAATLGRTPLPDVDEGFQPDGRNPDFLFVLQLTPELAETLADYEQVAFIDAHTGQIPQEIQFVPLEPGFQSSPFTHHMTPATLLSLSESLYGRAPQARLLSVRGYEFGFERGLSEQAEALAEEGVQLLLELLERDGKGQTQ